MLQAPTEWVASRVWDAQMITDSTAGASKCGMRSAECGVEDDLSPHFPLRNPHSAFLFNPPASQDPVAVVEHDRLTGGHTMSRLGEVHTEAIAG
jgi:hypothetical protein